MKLAIVIPFIEHEILNYNASLFCSLAKLAPVSAVSKIILIFLPQKAILHDKSVKSCLDLSSSELFNLDTPLSDLGYDYVVRVLEPPCLSVARNTGIDIAIEKSCTHIYFHDISVTLTSAFVDCVVRAITLDDLPFQAQPSFSVETECDVALYSTNIAPAQAFRVKPVFPAFNTYIWTYLFPVKVILGHRFNESIGPGATSDFLAGEDLLFLNSVLRDLDFMVYTSSLCPVVRHPPRTKDDPKHLIYARGQGYVYSYCAMRSQHVLGITYILLFFGNAILHVILLRKNSLPILHRRLFGSLQAVKERLFSR
jgi:hypothetical protein